MYMIFNKTEEKPEAYLKTQTEVDGYMEKLDDACEYDVIDYKGIEDCKLVKIGAVEGVYGMLTFIGGTDTWDTAKNKNNKYIDMDSKAVCVNFNTICGLYGLTEMFLKDDGIGKEACTSYTAFIADKDTVIPVCYREVCEFTGWMHVIGNRGKIKQFKAKKIKVYRMGGFDCVIQLIN